MEDGIQKSGFMVCQLDAYSVVGIHLTAKFCLLIYGVNQNEEKKVIFYFLDLRPSRAHGSKILIHMDMVFLHLSFFFLKRGGGV